MLENPELIKASAQLAQFITQQSTLAIRDKLRINKKSKSDKEKINVLEGIIQELLAEKNELIQIAQVYDEQMVAQKISEKDIEYITTHIVPLMEKLIDNDGGEKQREVTQKDIEIFKPLLSKETFNILQLIGFNYKRAIGEPLTELVSGLIVSQIPASNYRNEEANKLYNEREVEYLKMINDQNAYQRFIKTQSK